MMLSDFKIVSTALYTVKSLLSRWIYAHVAFNTYGFREIIDFLTHV